MMEELAEEKKLSIIVYSIDEEAWWRNLLG